MGLLNLVLLGPPGSGKSTQAEFAVKRLGLAHVDMGASLRKVAQEPSGFGKKLNEIINVRKELVPDSVIVRVLERIFRTIPSRQGLILDGAPRRSSQIAGVEKVFSETERVLMKVIYIRLPEEESVARIAIRYACLQCGKPFVLGKDGVDAHVPCMICGGALEQRKDDTPEGVRKRLEIFSQETLPVIDYFKSQGKLLEVDGTKDPEEIFQDILKGLHITMK